MMFYRGNGVRQVVDDLVHHHSVRGLVGNEGGPIGAHELRPLVALGSGERNGLLTVVYAEIPAVPQSLLKNPLGAADVEDESITGVALSYAPDRFIACCLMAATQSLPAVFAVLPGVITRQDRPHQEERDRQCGQHPDGHPAPHESGDERVLGILVHPRRYLPHPLPYSKREGSPAPRRTITACPLERSTTVVGISPHSPESTTA